VWTVECGRNERGDGKALAVGMELWGIDLM
jgi:hypothetical protein